MNNDNENEGMSTGKKVVAGAAVGVAVPAAVGVAKKLLGNGEHDQQDRAGASGKGSPRTARKSASSDRSRSSQGPRRANSASKRSSGGSSGKTTRSGSSAGRSRSRATGSSSGRSGSSPAGGSNRTKEQLYNQAKRLKIEGRSTMTKAQLERAISRARS